MVKIDFVNAQEPAINDTNLNQMQLNIENAIADATTSVVDSLDSTSTTDALSANQGRLLGEYSINNEIVVGHWTDNKPIYRKVVSGQVSTANTWTTIATISNINILIDVKGTVGGYLSVPVYISSSFNVAVQKNNNEIQVRTAGYTNNDVVLAIEYTKTTD